MSRSLDQVFNVEGKWHVTFVEIEAFLSEQGFVLEKIFHEGGGMGTALFVRGG